MWQSVGVPTLRYAAALVLVALLLAGCGTQAHSQAPSSGAVSSAFHGSPAPLASLHTQANDLLGGGTAAFKQRMASLAGYPVVVNKWASWCDPCQTEFPAFQRAAVTFGKRVGFVGVDGKDHNGSAKAFLARFPVTYPSYTDPQEQIASSIQAATYYPQTVYFDRNHKIVFDHAGPYLSAAALERDIRRYALR